ncbi:hypothetical protein [Citrobacter youngae]|uniref:hypothetical protein n=1 Tax=Citrobacter youngae TaxID=133448 RepID=UPI003F1B3714
MKALNKQALRVPERKRRDWSQAVMRDCDFCSQWALTIHHEDGGCICASCCDAEYTSELKGALETAIDLAEAAEHTAAVDHEAACSLVEENEEVKRKLEAAEKRIAELVARIYIPQPLNIEDEYQNYEYVAGWNDCRNATACRSEHIDRAAGIGVKGE